ncbi:hypothetical protein J6590_094503 [Homalodisca vitripennis]|nr:hypothetical protein J6590_094503 [Homalodisca vitripennis]
MSVNAQRSCHYLTYTRPYRASERLDNLAKRLFPALEGRYVGLESELEIAQVRILSVTVALFISTIDLVLYRLSPLFCLIRSSHRPVAHEDGQSKALEETGFSFTKKKKNKKRYSSFVLSWKIHFDSPQTS